ncbi:MAG: dihydroxyacetone kinase phosphoryl donor subunit DhaM [Ignavibacteriales bacterium]
MVNIVVVSHSRQIALGLKELLDQLASGGVRVYASGGAGDGGLGTDVPALAGTITDAAGNGDALIIPDIGSSVLGAFAALELVEDSVKARTAVADAPLVEGAVAATVQASVGADLDDVRRAAEEARTIRKI